jgi:hypothetical protein
MHAAAFHLVPILGAEKNKTPYFIVGGALVLWALVLSLGIGMRRPDFPSDARGQRLVIAITALLVVGTMGAAVATSGTPSKATTSSAAPAASGGASPSGAGSSASDEASAGAAGPPAGEPAP